MAKKSKMELELESEKKTMLQDSVSSLQSEIDSMLDNFDSPIDDMLSADDILPDLGTSAELHDYQKDIDLTRLESKETLRCLANLYISEESMDTKNIYSIIKNDATQLSELNFSILCAKRALIQCMTQIDCGNNDPEMYKSIAAFQKEMRDTVKMAYDIQKKMKDFYKELKHELPDLNNKEELPELTEEGDEVNIFDSKEINNFIDILKTDRDSIYRTD